MCGYMCEFYFVFIDCVKVMISGCVIITDIISGFCGEIEDDYEDIVSLMSVIGYE